MQKPYPATALKDNKKCFYKDVSITRRAKENLQPLLDMRDNVVAKDEGKVEVLNPSLPLA